MKHNAKIDTSLPRQILLLCGICLAADCAHSVLPFPMPSSVLAMLFVLGLLLFRVIKPHNLERLTNGLQRYMAFFFIPSCVSVLAQADIMLEHGLTIVLICVVGTVVTFLITAMVTAALITLMKKGDEGA